MFGLTRVQLFRPLPTDHLGMHVRSLQLADSLINNCKIELHREISSRAFTQTLTRLVQDRVNDRAHRFDGKGDRLTGLPNCSWQTTHDKVKRRTMQLLKQWSETFKKDESLGIVEETFETLRKTCEWLLPRSTQHRHCCTDIPRTLLLLWLQCRPLR